VERTTLSWHTPCFLAFSMVSRCHPRWRQISGAPAVLVAAIRAGERTSNLVEALDDYMRFDSLIEQLRRKVVSASIYPALVTTLGVGIFGCFSSWWLLPNFARMYQNLRGRAGGRHEFDD